MKLANNCKRIIFIVAMFLFCISGVCMAVCNHASSNYEYASDGDEHVKVCMICFETIESTRGLHNYEYGSDGNEHVKTCTVCYDEIDRELHSYQYASDGDEHVKVCTVCYDEIDRGSHDYKYASDGKEHVKVCTVCYDEIDRGSHDYQYAVDGKEHVKVCTVCYDEINRGSHNYEYASDGTEHVKVCTVCYDEIDRGSHDYEYASDGKEHVKVCTICYDEIDRGLHDYQYVKDGSNYHVKSCTVCYDSDPSTRERHTFSGTTCTKCGAKKSDTGSGDVNCSHISGGWQNNEVHHWKECTKCKEFTVTKDYHTYDANNVCTACGYKKVVDSNISSTIKAAPTSGRIIDSTDYIILTIEDADGIDYTEYKWSTRTEYTKRIARGATTAKVYTSSVGTHREGTYTLEVRVTDLKGRVTTATFEYKLRNDDDDDDCSHTYSAWKSDSSYHWKECTKCGEEESKAVHTFSGNRCTVCSYLKSSSGSGSSSSGGSGSSSTKGAPEITVSPKDGSTVEFGDRIKITAEDDDGIDYVEYYWNKETAVKRYDAEFTVKVPSKEGKNYLYVRAKDEDGKRGSYEKFTFDVEENNYPGNADIKGELNKNVKDLRVEIGNVDDRIVYEPGEEIKYYVDYYNGTSSKISSVKIVVEVPNSNFQIVNVKDGTKTTKKATWSLGTLKSGEDGRVYFTIKYNEDKELNKDLIFNVEVQIYKSSKVQDTSFTRNMIYSEKSKQQDNHTAYVSGYPDGRVKPDGSITRAEMATMIARMAGVNINTYAYRNTFEDVSADFWGAKAIQACVDEGLVEAYSNGRFEPEMPATRGMISYAIAKILGVEDKEPIYIKATDSEDSTMMIPVEQMIRLNIIDGYDNGTAKPDKAITRAEAMVIINKYLFRGELLSDDEDLPYYGAPVQGFRQFTDLPLDHWAYNHIMEATCDHRYVRNHDGNEIIKY